MVNWKLRFKNKPVLVALIAFVTSVAYQLLAIFNIVPPIAKSQVEEWANLGLDFLLAMGIIVDPTTIGFSDSQRALDRVEPGDNVNTAADEPHISDVSTSLESEGEKEDAKG